MQQHRQQVCEQMASEQESRSRYSNVHDVEPLLSVWYTPPFIQMIQMCILHVIPALPTAVGMNILILLY